MKFCPTCDIRLKTINSELKCIKCGHIETKLRATQNTNIQKSDFNILENDENISLPTIDIKCEKCDNVKAVWWMLQTRSADEPTTQFYRCTKCNYTWRNYA
ncbi:MAG: transcription factor S [Nitrosopumilaceae archaeon]|nr:transcription factor S [Nitrosopumilaceae archaeon]